jgi:hypothetical protein
MQNISALQAVPDDTCITFDAIFPYSHVVEFPFDMLPCFHICWHRPADPFPQLPH